MSAALFDCFQRWSDRMWFLLGKLKFKNSQTQSFHVWHLGCWPGFVIRPSWWWWWFWWWRWQLAKVFWPFRFPVTANHGDTSQRLRSRFTGHFESRGKPQFDQDARFKKTIIFEKVERKWQLGLGLKPGLCEASFCNLLYPFIPFVLVFVKSAYLDCWCAFTVTPQHGHTVYHPAVRPASWWQIFLQDTRWYKYFRIFCADIVVSDGIFLGGHVWFQWWVADDFAVLEPFTSPLDSCENIELPRFHQLSNFVKPGRCCTSPFLLIPGDQYGRDRGDGAMGRVLCSAGFEFWICQLTNWDMIWYDSKLWPDEVGHGSTWFDMSFQFQFRKGLDTWNFKIEACKIDLPFHLFPWGSLWFSTWKTIWAIFFDHTLLTIIFNHYGFFPNTATKPIYGVFCPYVFCSERIVGDLSEEARPRICFWGIIWWFSRSNQIWSQILPYLGPYLRGTSKILVDYQHFVEKIQYAYFNVWPQILPYLNRIWTYLGSDSLRQNVQGEIKHMINRQIRPTGPYGQKKWSIRHMIKKNSHYG